MGRSLTYPLLDELEVACGVSSQLPRLDLVIQSLGPLIQFLRSDARTKIEGAMAVAYPKFRDVAEFLANPNGLYLEKTGGFGIAAASTTGDAAIELMQRALLAINKTAFPHDAATQAISALGELDSNIEEHSQDQSSGIIAFEIAERFLGIYASDNGLGVLNSLRRNPAFSTLDDSGEALRLAVQEGVSSSTEVGRGMGFRPIFVGLASLCALLRFRSGDSVLEINGFGDSTPSQEIKERSPILGFHAFVHCTFGR